MSNAWPHLHQCSAACEGRSVTRDREAGREITVGAAGRSDEEGETQVLAACRARDSQFSVVRSWRSLPGAGLVAGGDHCPHHIIGIPWGRVLRHRQLLVLPLRQGSDQQARHASTEGGQEGLPCVTITLLFPQSGDGLRVARRQGLQKLGVVTKLRQRSQAAKRHRAPAIARRRFLGANVRLQE